MTFGIEKTSKEWNLASMVRREATKEHMSVQRMTEWYRQRTLRDQKLNQEVYNRLVTQKKMFDAHSNQVWYDIIFCTNEELLAKSKIFWLMIQLEKNDIDIQRSVIYKIDAFESEYGKSQIPQSTRQLIDDTRRRISWLPEQVQLENKKITTFRLWLLRFRRRAKRYITLRKRTLHKACQIQP
jgi:hypothetical protein